MNKKVIVYVIIGILITAIVGTITALVINKKHMSKVVERNVIYEGIYIEKVHIGGLSKEEAIKQVQAEIKAFESQKQIKILAQGKELHLLPYSYFENNIDYQALIENAYKVARTGDIKKRYKEIKNLEKNPMVFSIKDQFNKGKISELIDSLKQQYDIAPHDASIERINNTFVISDEVVGKFIEVEESINKIELALINGMDFAELDIVETYPEITKDRYTEIKDLIGSYHTGFSSYQAARNENLRVASNLINKTILMPGQIFSTNEKIGPVTAENGYKEAPIIVDGKIQPGIGGGVCQIATTLYNAVLLAELEIVERKNHSMPVGYIVKGRDATLAGDYIDFKFKNNTDTPIYIESYVEGNQLFMNLYSKEMRPLGRTIDFETTITDTIMPPPPKVILDSNLKPGEEIVEKKSTIGYTVKLYKLIYNDGQLIEKIELNTSTYKAEAAEIRRGTEPIAHDDSQTIEEDHLPSHLPVDREAIEEDHLPSRLPDEDTQLIEDTLPSFLPEEETQIIEENDLLDYISDEGITEYNGEFIELIPEE